MKRAYWWLIAIGGIIVAGFIFKNKQSVFAIFSADKSTTKSKPNVPGAGSMTTPPTGAFSGEV